MFSVISKEEDVVIKDLASFPVDFNKEDTVFIYGTYAKKLYLVEKRDPPKNILFFDNVEEYSQETGTNIKRAQAYKKLLILQDKMLDVEVENSVVLPDTVKTVTEETLPSITSNDLLSLEKNLLQKNVFSWKATTETGKTILVTKYPLDSKEPGVDMQLTFSELYAMKIMVETLRVKSIEVLYANTNNRNNSK